jgi:restriction system protein
MRQQVREQERQQRAEMAAAKAGDRERKQEQDAAGKAEAERLTRDVGDRVEELETILVRGLGRRARIEWESRLLSDRVDPLDLGGRAVPLRAPEWADFEPAAPGFMGSLLGGRARYEQQVAAARREFEQASRKHEKLETGRKRWIAEQEEAHRAQTAGQRLSVAAHNEAVRVMAEAVRARDRESVQSALADVLAAVPLPDGFPRRAEVAYTPRGEQAVVRVELPMLEVVPAVAGYSYVAKDQSRREKARPPAQVTQLYRSVISQVVLLYLRDLFDADELLESVELGGHVHATNRATGQQEYPCLISVAVDRAKFAEINLQQVRAEDCLKYLNALVSRHPHAMESVTPVRDFDRAKFSFVEAVDVAASVDSRSDLTAMTATEFEHFVRQVFESMGMQGWTTDRTGDDGVDAVVFNKDPIVGGLTIVQAKKYTRVLGVNHIRELVGAMDEKRAGRAILVTTSWFASGCWTKAQENGRIELIDGPRLRHLVKEHMGKDVLVAPPTGRRRDAGWVST